MNLIGTHDTERILTVLGNEEGDELSNEEKSKKRLDERQRAHGVELLKIAVAIQFTAYGIPSVFYGDEIGLEGYGDPFCRMTFPWHKLNEKWRGELLEYYRALGRIRHDEDALDGGSFYVVGRGDSNLVYVREKNDSRIIVAVNRASDFSFEVPAGVIYKDLISGEEYTGNVNVTSDSAMILKELGRS
jgi:glycosidase